jgi:hypothetical protein
MPCAIVRKPTFKPTSAHPTSRNLNCVPKAWSRARRLTPFFSWMLQFEPMADSFLYGAIADDLRVAQTSPVCYPNKAFLWFWSLVASLTG